MQVCGGGGGDEGGGQVGDGDVPEASPCPGGGESSRRREGG